MQKWTFCILITFLLGEQVFAQQYYFETWRAEDGLAVSDINAITEDPLGYLWLATEGGGAVRFDGVNFRALTVEEGLGSNFVTSFAWDADGKLWLGTEKGVCIYNGENFERLDSVPGFFGRRVVGIEILDEEVIVAFRHKIQRFSEGAFSDEMDDYFRDQMIHHLHRSDQELIISCDSGEVRGTPGNWLRPAAGEAQFFAFYGPQGQSVREITNYTVESFPGFFTDSVRGSDPVRAAIHWRNKLVYASGNRLFTTGQDGRTVVLDEENGLSSGRIKSLFSDRNGQLWIGSSNGLSSFVNPFMENYGTGLSDPRVHSLLETDGSLLVGTASGVERIRLESIDSKREKKRVSIDADIIDQLPSGLVFRIIRDKKNRIWFGTENGLYSVEKGKLRKWGAREGIEDDFIFDIYESNKLGMVVATSSNVYALDGNTFLPVLPEDQQSGARLIREDERSGLWLLMLSGEILHRLPSGESRKAQPGAVQEQLRINTFMVSSDGILVIGSSEGGILVSDQGIMESYSYEQGLFSDQIRGFTKVGENEYWVLLPEGIQHMSMDGTDLKFGRYLGNNDGFLGNESQLNSIFFQQDPGVIWCGTKSGAVRVDLRGLAQSPLEHMPVISRVDLFFNENSDWSAFSSALWSDVPESIKLRYDQNYLTFHFSALSSSNPDQLFFRYKLDHHEEDWIRAADRKSAIYTGIPHGKYTFMVETSMTPAF